MKKRMLSLAMALAMCLSLLPTLTVASLAEGEGSPTSGFCGIEGSEESVSWRLDVNHSEEHYFDETGQIEVRYDYTLIISGNGSMRDNFSPWDKFRYNITEIIIEDGVTAIGERSFFNTGNRVNRIEISNTVVSIGAYAFATLDGSIENRQINIPKSVAHIGERAFAGSFGSGVESFTVSPENEHFTAVNGVLYDKNVTKIVAYPSGSKPLCYTMPDTITGDVDLVLFWGSSLQNLVVSQNATIVCTQSIENPYPILCEDNLFRIYFKGEIPSDTSTWQIDSRQKIACESYTKPLQDLFLYSTDLWLAYSPDSTYDYGATNSSIDGGMLTYKSTDETIATIDQQGKLLTKSAEWVYIVVTAAETNQYAETSVCGLIEIIFDTVDIVTVDAELQMDSENQVLKINGIDFFSSSPWEKIDLIPEVDYIATLEFDSSATIIYEVTLSFKMLTKNYRVKVPDDVQGEYGVSCVEEGSWDVPLKTPIIFKPDEIVATSEVFLNGGRHAGLYNEETNLGDLVADAILWQAQESSPQAQIDAAIINSGCIRSDLQKGDITFGDLSTVQAFENTVVTVQVSGAELLELLEATTYIVPMEDPTFPQVAGITFTIDTTIAYAQGSPYSLISPVKTYYAPACPGSRVKDVNVNGQPLDLEATYTIATTDFAAAGGDAFGVLVGKNVSDTGVFTVNALTQYLKTKLNGMVTAAQYGAPTGRITIKTSSGGDSPSHSGDSSSSGGSSTPSKPTVTVGGDGKGGEVKIDRDGSVIITPDEGYQIEKITVNGKAVDIPEDGKLTGLKSSDKVEVTFAPIPESVPTPASELYPDVAPGAWYEEAATFVVDRGLFQGTDQGLFAPEAPMTRAMLLTVLARIEDVEPANEETWYGGALDWAVETGISDGTNPNTPITREQLVTMLYRYVGQPETAGGLAAFPDAARVSPFAVGAMSWAVEVGIINGTDTGILDPQGQATRAQVAKMLQAYLSLPSAQGTLAPEQTL